MLILDASQKQSNHVNNLIFRALVRFKDTFSQFLKDYEHSNERLNSEGGVYDAAMKYIQSNGFIPCFTW